MTMRNLTENAKSENVFSVLAVAMLLTTTLSMLSLASSSSAANQQSWAKTMQHTPTPSSGCFKSSYPSTAWRQVPCSKANLTSLPALAPSVGSGNDYSASASSNYIGYANGMFTSVSGITGEKDSANPCGNGVGTCSDYFTLQLNPNTFRSSSSCPGYSGYNGSRADNFYCWEQFVFYANGGSNGTAAIWYILVNYYLNNRNCAITPPPNSSDWGPYGNDCYSHTDPIDTPIESATNLASLSLAGSSAYAGSNNDEVVFCDFSVPECDSFSNTDTVLNLYQSWQIAEFNVFGAGEGSGALFSGSGSTMSVTIQDNLETGSGSVITPLCWGAAYTAEWNNLGFPSNPNPCSVSNNAMTVNEQAYYLTMQTSGCCGTVSPSSGYHSASEQVQIGATPNSGYALSSWSGSGPGSYSGTANPANVVMNGQIQETANFVPTYTVTFTESGVPSGSTWWVTFNGVQHSASAPNNIVFSNMQAGTYSFSVTTLTCGTGCRYSPSPSIGSITLGPSKTQPITFTKQYYLTTNPNLGSGTGTITPAQGYYNAGSQQTLKATPSGTNHFCFFQGYGSGSYSGTQSQATITMNAAIEEDADFELHNFPCPSAPVHQSHPEAIFPVSLIVSPSIMLLLGLLVIPEMREKTNVKESMLLAGFSRFPRSTPRQSRPEILSGEENHVRR